MELSTIKNTINSFANETAGRVKNNWNNLSTTGKVAAIASSILLTGAAVCAQFFGAGLLLSAVSALSISASHLIAHIAGAALGALGLAIPAVLLLKKEQSKPVVAQPVVKEEVVKTEVAVVETQTTQETVKPSRLTDLRNASVQFVQNHPRLVIAGSVLAIGVLSAGLMGAQRRGAIATYSRETAVNALATSKKLGNQALTKGKNIAETSKTVVQTNFVRLQSKLPGFAKK